MLSHSPESRLWASSPMTFLRRDKTSLCRPNDIFSANIPDKSLRPPVGLTDWSFWGCDNEGSVILSKMQITKNIFMSTVKMKSRFHVRQPKVAHDLKWVLWGGGGGGGVVATPACFAHREAPSLCAVTGFSFRIILYYIILYYIILYYIVVVL